MNQFDTKAFASRIGRARKLRDKYRRCADLQDRFSGHLSGPQGARVLSVQLPPNLDLNATSCTLSINDHLMLIRTKNRTATFTINLPADGSVAFSLTGGIPAANFDR